MSEAAPTPYLHAGLTQSILAAAIRVQDALGPGLLLNFWARPLKDRGIQRLVLTSQGR